MPFTDPIVGGNVLIKEAIQSPDYEPGVSGWTINRDGTVEFNDGTFRGDVTVNSLLAGTPGGARIEISDIGEMMVYNSSNELVANITPADMIYVLSPNGSYINIRLDALNDNTAVIHSGPVPIFGRVLEPAAIYAENVNAIGALLKLVSPVVNGNATSSIELLGDDATNDDAINLKATRTNITGSLKVKTHNAMYGETGSLLVSMTGASWIRNITFATPFAVAPTFVTANIANGGGSTAQWTLRCDSITTTGFRIIGGGVSSTTWTNVEVTWAAITNA